MYKKSKVVLLKRRHKRQQRLEQRKLSRRLLSGDLSLAQAERLAGDGLRGVLKTADYLSKKEGVSVNSALAEAMVNATTPAFALFAPARPDKRSSLDQLNKTKKSVVAITSVKSSTPAKPARATAKAAPTEAAAPAKPARATAKATSKAGTARKKEAPAPKAKGDAAKIRTRAKTKADEN